MPAHTTLPDHTVVIGVSADDEDLLAAIRAASHPSARQVVRLIDAALTSDLSVPAALAEGLGWEPTFRLPRVEAAHIVDMHLGGGL